MDAFRFFLLLGGLALLFGAEGYSVRAPVIDENADRLDSFNSLLNDDSKMDRRNDFFFAKNTHKTVPRIGRRNDFFHKAAKSVPRIGRSAELATENRIEKSAWPWFRDLDYYPRIVKKELVAVEEDDDSLQNFDLNKEQEELRLQPIVHQ